MAPSPSGLQRLVDVCALYGIDNDIIYNTKKTFCMIFKPHRYQLSCPDIYMNGNTLKYVEHTKYLGVVMTSNCKDDDDMMRHLRCRSNTILRKFYRCSVDVKLALFQAYCVPTYCSHLWVSYNKSTYNKLRVAFNNVYRRILGYTRRDSASNMFVSNRLDNFDMLMRKNVNKFHVRVRSISNTLVTNIYNLITLVNNTMWNKWMNILYINYVP